MVVMVAMAVETNNPRQTPMPSPNPLPVKVPESQPTNPLRSTPQRNRRRYQTPPPTNSPLLPATQSPPMPILSHLPQMQSLLMPILNPLQPVTQNLQIQMVRNQLQPMVNPILFQVIL
jgi:hypothetical protein